MILIYFEIDCVTVYNEIILALLENKSYIKNRILKKRSYKLRKNGARTAQGIERDYIQR